MYSSTNANTRNNQASHQLNLPQHKNKTIQEVSTGQSYMIQSKSSSKVLDICQDPDRKGQLILYSDYGGKNQQFQIIYSGQEVKLKSKSSGMFLTVAHDSDKNGAQIRQQPDHARPSQKFRIQEIQLNSKQYIIFTFCGKALDCFEDQTKNGTQIIQWDFHSKDNQKWYLKKL